MADELYHGINTFSGVQSKVFEDSDGMVHIQHFGDVEPTIERNKAVFNGHAGWTSDRTGEIDGMRHVASIPPVLCVALRDQGIDILNMTEEQERRLFQVLNSSDFRDLRTTPGVI